MAFSKKSGQYLRGAAPSSLNEQLLKIWSISMIKQIVLATALTAFSISMAFAQDLRMTVWTGSDAHLGMLNDIAEEFESTHPGVTVNFETIPFSDYVRGLTLQLAGGNPPDLGWLLESSAPIFVDAGVLLDVSDKLRNDAAYNFSDLSQSAMTLWQSSDAIYGIPFSTSPYLTYYNASMFSSAGIATPNQMVKEGSWTWEALRIAAKKLSDPANGVYGFQSPDGLGYDSRIMHTLIPIVRSYGGEAWVNGKCGFDSPEAIQAITLYHQMIFDDKSTVPPGEQANFFTGGAAMTINQISRVSNLDEANFEWGLAPLPSGPSGESPTIGQAAIVAFARGQNTELAAEFLKYMTDTKNSATMAQFFPTARKSVLEGDAFLNSNSAFSAEQIQIVADAISKGGVLPSHPAYPQIEAAMRPRFDALWQADAVIPSVMASVCRAIQPLL